MEFVNVENFKEWLENNLKDTANVNVENYLDEVKKDVCENYDCSKNGLFEYELRDYKTKSGNPELYTLKVVYEEKDDDIKTIIIF